MRIQAQPREKIGRVSWLDRWPRVGSEFYFSLEPRSRKSRFHSGPDLIALPYRSVLEFAAVSAECHVPLAASVTGSDRRIRFLRPFECIQFPADLAQEFLNVVAPFEGEFLWTLHANDANGHLFCPHDDTTQAEFLKYGFAGLTPTAQQIIEVLRGNSEISSRFFLTARLLDVLLEFLYRVHACYCPASPYYSAFCSCRFCDPALSLPSWALQPGLQEPCRAAP